MNKMRATRECWSAIDGHTLVARGGYRAEVCIAHRGEFLADDYLARFLNVGEFFK